MFASPCRFGLEFTFRVLTPAREVLDVWLPIQIRIFAQSLDDGNNIITTLKHHDCVCSIVLSIRASSLLEQLATMMQEPFPVLMNLDLTCLDLTLVLSDTFLGGSAPSLQSLMLSGISFLALLKLLLSA